jgi:hypothetical protein
LAGHTAGDYNAVAITVQVCELVVAFAIDVEHVLLARRVSGLAADQTFAMKFCDRTGKGLTGYTTL